MTPHHKVLKKLEKTREKLLMVFVPGQERPPVGPSLRFAEPNPIHPGWGSQLQWHACPGSDKKERKKRKTKREKKRKKKEDGEDEGG